MLSAVSSELRLKDGEKPALIELQQVDKEYETPAGPFRALQHVDLTIQPGEFAAVVGKSGSGKTTLINMVTGIDRPSRGQVRVGDVWIHRLSENNLAIWRGKTIGVVFQFFQLIPTLTLIENVYLPMDFCGQYSPRKRKSRAFELLDEVGLSDCANKLPAATSGGQQQRAAIARALANDPQILVADEPTGNLDSATAGSVIQLFERLVDQGKTILIVTHDPDLAIHCSRIIHISDGIISDTIAAVDGSCDERTAVIPTGRAIGR